MYIKKMLNQPVRIIASTLHIRTTAKIQNVTARNKMLYPELFQTLPLPKVDRLHPMTAVMLQAELVDGAAGVVQRALDFTV